MDNVLSLPLRVLSYGMLLTTIVRHFDLNLDLDGESDIWVYKQSDALIMSPFFDLDMSSMGMSGSRKPLMFLLLLRRKVVRRQIWTFLYLHLPISFTSSTDCWCWIIFYSAWLISKSFPVPRYHLPWYPAAEARQLRWHAHLVWWARPTLLWALCPASWVGLIHAVSIPSIVVVFFMKLIVLFFCFHDVVVCFVFVVLNFVTMCS